MPSAPLSGAWSRETTNARWVTSRAGSVHNLVPAFPGVHKATQLKANPSHFPGARTGIRPYVDIFEVYTSTWDNGQNNNLRGVGSALGEVRA